MFEEAEELVDAVVSLLEEVLQSFGVDRFNAQCGVCLEQFGLQGIYLLLDFVGYGVRPWHSGKLAHAVGLASYSKVVSRRDN